MEIQNRFPTNFESGTVVIFGGSFDPVTYTHIQVASEVLNFGLADQVWIVPCGMRTDKATTISPVHRLAIVTLAINAMVPEDSQIFVEGTEVVGGRYYPTTELMRLYRARYPGLRFKVLLGNDLLPSLHLWDDFPDLIAENKFMVYTRIYSTSSLGNTDEDDIVTLCDSNHTRLSIERIRNSFGFTPIISNISSTEVRKRMRMEGLRAIVGLTPLVVYEYIKQQKLYS